MDQATRESLRTKASIVANNIRNTDHNGRPTKPEPPADTRDPRSHRRYTEAATTYIEERKHRPIDCALCGDPINMKAPRTQNNGPTIEHRIPIRDIIKRATTYADAVAACCDTSSWAIAHRSCQNRQGGTSKGEPAEPQLET